jgi:hypothetical protein
LSLPFCVFHEQHYRGLVMAAAASAPASGAARSSSSGGIGTSTSSSGGRSVAPLSWHPGGGDIDTEALDEDTYSTKWRKWRMAELLAHPDLHPGLVNELLEPDYLERQRHVLRPDEVGARRRLLRTHPRCAAAHSYFAERRRRLRSGRTAVAHIAACCRRGLCVSQWRTHSPCVC